MNTIRHSPSQTNVFVLLIACFAGLAMASDPPPALWQQTAGSEHCDQLSSLQEVAPGEIGGAGSINRGGFGGSDYWLFLTDKDDGDFENLLFGGTNILGFGGSEGASSLVVASQGGFLLAGTSGAAPSGNKTAPLLGAWDYWVIRLNADMSIAWQRSYGGPGFDALYQAVETDAGRFVLSGHMADLSAGGPGAGVYLVCIDQTGAVVWDRFFISEMPAKGEGVAPTAGGGLLLATQTYEGQELGIRLRALNSEGAVAWERSMPASGVELSTLQGAFPDGFVLGGTKVVESGVGVFHYWLMRLDAGGETLWERTYHGNGGADLLRAVGCFPDGGFVVGGSSYSGHGFDKTGYQLGEYDFWLVRTDGLGRPMWDLVYGSSADEQLASIRVTSDGGFLVGGVVDSNFYDPDDRGDRMSPDLECSDVWLVKFAADPTPPEESDADGDGVPDAIDQCPGSQEGPVDAQGCGLLQLCPPPHTSHERQAYLHCVRTTLRQWVQAGWITQPKAQALRREAFRALTGPPGHIPVR